jgi:hypothetical protein
MAVVVNTGKGWIDFDSSGELYRYWTTPRVIDGVKGLWVQGPDGTIYDAEAFSENWGIDLRQIELQAAEEFAQ